MNDLNNFDTISHLDDTVTRLECGINNLSYMLEFLEDGSHCITEKALPFREGKFF